MNPPHNNNECSPLTTWFKCKLKFMRYLKEEVLLKKVVLLQVMHIPSIPQTSKCCDDSHPTRERESISLLALL